jgi:hypothetical protein
MEYHPGDQVGFRDLLAQVEKRLQEIRQADTSAAKVAQDELGKDIDRLEKDVMARITRLEQDSIQHISEIQKRQRLFLTEESYDLQHQALINQIQAVERWQYKLIGGLVFATFVAPMVTGFIVYIVNQEFL